ncbi:MAG: DUF2892 domain-containing protein [Gammaproteobacteria bacterium]|nr:DUF2892 domain-containing protein [Gammaproteobacteria bacterium]
MGMVRNVGGLDRVFRGVIGLALIYIGVFSGWLGTDYVSAYVLCAIGGIFTLTAIFSYCPAYGFVGLNTTQTNKDRKK